MNDSVTGDERTAKPTEGSKMKLKWMVIAFGVTVFMAGQLRGAEPPVLKDQREKMSYIMGMEIGASIKGQGIDIDHEIFLRGIKDILKGNKTLLTEQEIRDTVARFQKEMTENQQTLAERNKKDAEAFLSGDKKKEGIVVLPSGLQYKVIRTGTGGKPRPTDTVTVRFRAALVDGTEVDSSSRHGQPDTFRVNEMMPGVAEALTLMQQGSKWLLFVPPNLGYGERGAGGLIGPNTSVLFEVELLAITENW